MEDTLTYPQLASPYNRKDRCQFQEDCLRIPWQRESQLLIGTIRCISALHPAMHSCASSSDLTPTVLFTPHTDVFFKDCPTLHSDILILFLMSMSKSFLIRVQSISAISKVIKLTASSV